MRMVTSPRSEAREGQRAPSPVHGTRMGGSGSDPSLAAPSENSLRYSGIRVMRRVESRVKWGVGLVKVERVGRGTVVEVRETGQVWCPLRMAGLARDRCVGNQRAGVCGCAVGVEVELVWREHLAWEEEERRRRRELEERVKEYGWGRRPPWKLRCRRCGRGFEKERAFGAKPVFCGMECRKAELREQKRRYARHGQVREVGVSDQGAGA